MIPVTAVKRRTAIKRGLRFVYLTACNPQNFEDYGFDYVFCFNWLYSTLKDPYLRAMALRMGQECALDRTRNNRRSGQSLSILLVLGLVAGASERLVPNMIKKVEGTIVIHDEKRDEYATS